MKHRQAPSTWTFNEIQNHHEIIGIDVEINGKWVPARPLGLDTLSNRIKTAWKVFTGECDAFRWPEGQ